MKIVCSLYLSVRAASQRLPSHNPRSKPIYLYINSSGTNKTDGQIVGLETEGTAIYDAMCFVRNEVSDVR